MTFLLALKRGVFGKGSLSRGLVLRIFCGLISGRYGIG